MKSKRMLAFLLALAMVLSTCVVPMQSEAKTKKTKTKKTKISKVLIKNDLYGKKLYVAKGKKVTIKPDVKVTPNKKANKKVTFKSKNKKIAKVDKKGKVTGKKLGTTKITITSKKNKKKKKTISVQVTNPVKSVKLSQTSLSLYVGKYATLKATVVPTKKVCKYVKWTSSNPKVATVDANGKIVAVAEGTAKITASAVDGTKKAASCTVVVKKPVVVQPKPVAKYNIKSVKIIDEHFFGESNEVMVTLTAAKDLKKESFQVVRKKDGYQAGDAGTRFDVEKIKKVNGYTYILETNKEFCEGDYCQVTIPELDGKKVGQCRYILPVRDTNRIILGNVCELNDCDKSGVEPHKNYIFSYVDFDNMFKEYTAKLTSGTLPKGLTFDIETDTPSEDDEYYDEEDDEDDEDEEDSIYYVVYGCPKQATSAAGVKVEFTGTDSLNRNSKATCQIYIGDKKQLFTSNQKYEKGEFWDFESIYLRSWVLGGSGEYKVRIDDAELATLFEAEVEDEYIEFYAEEGTVPAGSYKLHYTVTDANNTSLSATGVIEFSVEKSNRVTLHYDGCEYMRKNVVFVNADEDEFQARYDKKKGQDYVCLPTGVYNVYLCGDFEYEELLAENVKVDKDMEKTLCANDKNLFKLKIVEKKNITSAKITLSNDDDDFYKYCGTLEDMTLGKIPDGEYDLKIECSDFWQNKWFEYCNTTITVENGYVATIELKDSVYVQPDIAGELRFEEGKIDISSDECYEYIRFYAPTPGKYSITLLDMDKEDLDSIRVRVYHEWNDDLLEFDADEPIIFDAVMGFAGGYYIGIADKDMHDSVECTLDIKCIEPQ